MLRILRSVASYWAGRAYGADLSFHGDDDESHSYLPVAISARCLSTYVRMASTSSAVSHCFKEGMPTLEYDGSGTICRYLLKVAGCERRKSGKTPPPPSAPMP